MPKELTRHQVSSRLAYSQTTPSFLLKFQNRIAGVPEDDDPEYDDNDEFERPDGSGRPPIPKRPSIPERPADDPGSADEDDGDERPVVVVLREGKHLTAREAENEKRKEKGLPPVPEPEQPSSTSRQQSPEPSHANSKKGTSAYASLSFSSSKSGSKSNGKRKLVGGTDGDSDKRDGGKSGTAPKKVKKNAKSLLSFSDEA